MLLERKEREKARPLSFVHRARLAKRARSMPVLLLTFCLLIITMLPIVWIALLSIKTQLQAFDIRHVFVFDPTLENYDRLLADGTFRDYLINSLTVAVGTVAASLLIGTPAAYIASRSPWRRFQMAALGYSVFIRIVPPMVFVIPYFLVFRNVGLSDTKLGLVIAYANVNIPLVMWSMWNFFNEIPAELDEAAKADGATLWQTFTKVVVPVAAPGLAATAILTFIMSWNEFLLALVLTSREARTLPVAIVGFLAYEGADWGLVSAGSVLIMAPIIFFTVVIQKYLVQGLVGGALKG
ncbi:MAG: carbohydrate ABC transporter permease [Dehalococcoidales bacterium]|nr:carbohydrate ABC transporter permease [Dehalococcoidales bacterium]